MRNVFEPPYLNEAGAFMGRERNLKYRARKLILEITDSHNLEPARRARELMKDPLKYKEKRTRLYARYKKEVLKNAMDDHFDPEKAITYAFKYFASLMKQQKGDIRLALASYNAGPHRIKQYKGIPPYAETIQFRNRVLGYYRPNCENSILPRGSIRRVWKNEKAPDESTNQQITGAEQKVP